MLTGACTHSHRRGRPTAGAVVPGDRSIAAGVRHNYSQLYKDVVGGLPAAGSAGTHGTQAYQITPLERQDHASVTLRANDPRFDPRFELDRESPSAYLGRPCISRAHTHSGCSSEHQLICNSTYTPAHFGERQDDHASPLLHRGGAGEQPLREVWVMELARRRGAGPDGSLLTTSLPPDCEHGMQHRLPSRAHA